MGYKFSYSDQDISAVHRIINSIRRDITYSKGDGFCQWQAKQDIYRLKFIIDDIIKQTPKFSLEDDWLREQEKNQVMKILKDDL